MNRESANCNSFDAKRWNLINYVYGVVAETHQNKENLPFVGESDEASKKHKVIIKFSRTLYTIFNMDRRKEDKECHKR